LLWIVFALNISRVLIWRLQNFTNNFFQPRVMADLVNSCYQYLQEHSYTFFANSFVGSLVTKVKRYERAFETIADQICFDLGRSMLDTGFILVVLFFYYPTFAWMSLAWLIIYFAFVYAFALYKLPIDIKRAEADTKTTGQLADSLTNNINVKLFSAYKDENSAFEKVTDNQYKLRRRSWNLGTWGDLFQSVSMVILELAAIYYALILWQKGLLQVGDVVLLQAYLFRMFDKLWNTGKNVRSIYEALADANEMTQMIVSPHEIRDPANAKSLKITKSELEFKKVYFYYREGSNVLDNFNLKINEGEKIALIGPSGGGKTTIVKLLLRFLDIQKGKILIDGQEINKVSQNSLRNAIAFVPQEPILFHRSLIDNIRYGRPGATDEEVIEAAKLAHAHEFILSFNECYNTLVGERGVKLSGGERQRVAIARAILKDAPILILDEATSSLDSESERLIQDALEKLMKNKTVIVIAHRLSTIMKMDRIVVIEHGKIAEEGKHTELLKAKQGIYQRLWEIQAGGFA
jgi:ATP-binding cassette subfamily B protein